MKPNSIRLLAAAAVLCFASLAQAVVTCAAPTSAGFSTAYASNGVVPNVTQTSVDVTCTRTVAGDPTVVYLRANNSNHCAGGGNNEATFGGSCIQYEVYKVSSCTGAIWTNNAAGSIPVTFSTVGTQTVTVPVWACITVANQTPAAGAGTYLDTVTTSVRDSTGPGSVTYSSGTFSGSITYPATCLITSIQNVAFGTYVAFRATPLVVPASIVLNCTSRLPYTMALDATTGVLNNGLYYSLALSTASSRGTGPGQTHTVTGTMPANQAGTCATGSCVATPQTRTLTVTY